MAENLFSPRAMQELRELVGYEDWLLQSVYKLTENELFPEWPDSVVFDAETRSPVTTRYGRSHVVLGDWRPGFQQAATPLIFATSFKLLDMLVEWILKNEGPIGFSFSEKIKKLTSLNLRYPSFLESRPWLVERIKALYIRSEPLRSSIIHSKNFSSEDGVLRVASSKRGVIGESIELSADDLRIFAQFSVSVLRFLYGDWSINAHREKYLRWQVDSLQKLHKLELLGQKQPLHTRVRWNTYDPNVQSIDWGEIQRYLSNQNPGQDVTFDLRVVVLKENNPIAAYFIPFEVLPLLNSLVLSEYYCQIPK